jgi:SAM-dependent methyltransferase
MTQLKRFPAKDITLNTRMYDEYIREYRMKNGWAPGNQVYNFKALLRLPQMTGVPLRGKSVLDVGCGTGDLVKFLRQEKISRYIGVDIYQPSLEQARKQYPDEIFIEGDLLNNVVTDTVDYAFCSGALTIKLSVDNYDFLEAMIAKMWELTRIGLAFNVLTDEDPEPDSELFFYNPEKVLAICHSIAPNAVLGAEETPHVAQIHVYMYREMAKS